jgi:hypothetical protein
MTDVTHLTYYNAISDFNKQPVASETENLRAPLRGRCIPDFLCRGSFLEIEQR